MSQTKPKINPTTLSRNLSITALSLTGKNQSEIARTVGLSQQQVSQILKDDQCKAIIDKTLRIYIAHSHGIAKRFLQLCYDPDKKISLDAIKHYNQIIGIAGTHTVNQFFANIYNDNRSIITDDVARLFGMLSGQMVGEDDEIIDV